MSNIFITGAANGLGAEIAKQASAQGYRVGIFDLALEQTQALAEQLSNAQAFAGDVCDPDAVAAAMDAFGDVDALVNNAGINKTNDKN